jgi:protein-arginine kinase activator protein McsA
MSLSIEYIVRHEASKQLRARGRFFCVSCLATFLRDVLGTYTKVQIERALQTVSKTPGALTYKHAFVCDQCGKTAPCLGAK